MAPFGEGCARDALGPCSIPNAANLDAGRADALLQLRRGEQRPALLDAQFRNLAPERIAPPLPDENGRGQDAAGKVSAVAAPASVAQTLAARQEQGVIDRLPATPATVILPVIVVPPAIEPQAVQWGRWKALAGETPAASLAELTAGGRQLIGLNPLFAITRDAAPQMVMPGSGVFDFRLQSYSSFFYDESKQTVQQAQIQNPSLTIDFNNRSFATRFDVTNDNRTTDVSAKGGVTREGLLYSNVITSNADVRGALAGSAADQAGLMFARRIDATTSAVGATFWRR